MPGPGVSNYLLRFIFFIINKLWNVNIAKVAVKRMANKRMGHRSIAAKAVESGSRRVINTRRK